MRDQTDTSCVLVDEAQFLTPEQVRQLHRVAHVAEHPGHLLGIRSDFVGEPFPGAAYLLTLADSLEEIKTICNCGKKATMNPRVDDEGRRITIGAQIAIEGETRYAPMCGRCFYDEKARAEPVALAKGIGVTLFALPRTLRVGGGAVAETPAVLAGLELKRPLIVTDPFFAQNGLAARVATLLADAGIPSRTYSDTIPIRPSPRSRRQRRS